MLRILHLSDLHYGWIPGTPSSPSGPGTFPVPSHRFIANGKPDPVRLAQTIVGDFTEPPHLVIVSGDIAWASIDEDYIYATRFFRHLRSHWKDTRLVIAPGNHDVDRKKLGERQHAFIRFLHEVHDDDFEKQYPLLKGRSTDRNRLVAFLRVKPSSEDDILVVAANSAAHLEDGGVPVGFAATDLEAIDEGIHNMRAEASTLRLFVLHHPLFPFAEPHWGNTIDPAALNEKPDPTTLGSSATLQSWLAERSFRVVLHGHKHIMHGRSDTLWRRRGPRAGSRIFVLGAGSAGVEQGHVAHGESLSFNMLHVTRLAHQRWNVDVSMRVVPDPPAKPEESYSFATEIGDRSTNAPLVFHAETMADCHRAIKLACKPQAGAGQTHEDKRPLFNFVSVVETAEYTLPATAWFRGKAATQEQIESTFDGLHPEYKRTESWRKTDKLDGALREMSPRFQFQHGPRLFGKPHGRKEAPIIATVDNLQKLSSNGYVSLSRPEIDTHPPQGKPVPHMIGLQFILDGQFLDAVVTFRKIELSYWWVANMYEIGKLLHWAAKRSSTESRKPRRITFFAAIAEWKADPEAAFATQLDEMSLEELTKLVAGIYANLAGKNGELVALLKEKRQHTNVNNLDAAGLSRLSALFAGMAVKKKVAGLPGTAFLESIGKAADLISRAMPLEDEKSVMTDDARAALAEAIHHLGGSVDDP